MIVASQQDDGINLPDENNFSQRYRQEVISGHFMP